MIDYYSGRSQEYKFHRAFLLGHELNDKEYESINCRMLRPSKDQASDEETGLFDAEVSEFCFGIVQINACWKS